MIPFNDFKRQNLSPEMEAVLSRFLKDSHFILGQNVQAFEEEFARFCGATFAVGVASGTDALKLSLVACGVKPGDEVLTVSFTAVPTVLAISEIGAKPLFVDIDPVTMTLDPDLLQKKITNRTKAIIPVHLYGQPAKMEEIIAFARQKKIAVIEDACQAHGASIHGKKVGTFGEAGCFSFYPTKNLGAYGDGGMVVTDNADLCEKIKVLRNCGQVNRYEHAVKGFNSRLDELQAAFLRVKLKRLDLWTKQRKEKAALYQALLKDLPLTLPVNENGHVYHLYVIRSALRDQIMEELKKKGISTLIHYPIPAHLQAAYQDIDGNDLPITEQCAKEVLSLPLYPELKESEIKKVAEALHEIFS